MASRSITFIRQLNWSVNTIWVAQYSGQVVAVKTPDILDGNLGRERLFLEAWFLKRLGDIDNVIQLLCYDASEEERPGLIMPYMTGGSLQDSIRSNIPPVKERAQILLFVADALQRIHARGILHLDMKPGNILLDSNGKPFLADFGHAAFFDEIALQAAANDEVRALLENRARSSPGGTPEYMAPEQFDLTPAQLSPCSDIYSLGISLFELLARRKPYLSHAEDPEQQRLELRQMHRQGILPDVLDLNSDLEPYPSVKGVLAKALHPEPAGRYQSAAEFAVDVRLAFE